MKNNAVYKEDKPIQVPIKKSGTWRKMLAAACGTTYITDFFWFSLAFIYAGSSLSPGYYPFGVALCAAYCFTRCNVVVSLGAFLGYMFFLGSGGLAYCGAILVCACCGVMADQLEVKKNKWYMPLMAGVSMCLTVGIVSANNTERSLIITLCEILVCICFTYFYASYRENSSPQKRAVGRLALYVTAVLFLTGITLYGTISVARVVVVLGILLYSYQESGSESVFVALIGGVLMDISRGSTPYFSGLYGLTVMATSVLKLNTRFKIAVAYTGVTGLLAFIMRGSSLAVASLWECFFAASIFAALPENVAQIIGARLYIPVAEKVEVKDRPITLDNKIAQLATAISGIAESLTAGVAGIKRPVNQQDISQVFDRAADKVCRKCAIAASCWEADYINTFGAMNDVTATLSTRGFLNPEDFPYHFSARCLNITGLTGYINQEYSLYVRRRQGSTLSHSKAQQIATHYSGLNRAVDNIAQGISNQPEYFPEQETRVERVLVCYDKNARASVYAIDGRMFIEIYNVKDSIMVDMPQISDSLALSLGREFAPGERIVNPRGIVVRLRERERYRVGVNVGIREKKGENVSGDSSTYFTTEDGRAVIMLSDGMGSGIGAHEVSQNAIALISRFVKAGCSLKESVEAVLPALAVNVERVGFTTLDLLEINLFTGESKLIKYGTPPSYLKRQDKVQKYVSIAFPAGLEDSGDKKAEPTLFKMSHGSFVVMATDGVFNFATTDSTEGDIKNAKQVEGLVNQLIDTAYRTEDTQKDDMTAIVIELKQA